MSYERMWERLLEFLNGWSSATEVSPGRIEVTLEGPGGSTRDVEILMTRHEWDDMASVAWGQFDAAAEQVRTKVLGLRHDERFLLYRQYELVASATPELPVDPEDARLEELARQPPEGFGRWVALDQDGNVVDELRTPRD